MSEILDIPKKVVGAIGGLFGGGGGGDSGGFFSGITQPAPAPAPEAVKTLLTPTALPTDENLNTAKRKQTAAAAQRKGRASTVLTSQEDALGGGY